MHFGRVVLLGCPPDVADKRLGRRGVEFRSLRATMSQNPSVPQALAQRELRKTLEEVLEALGP
jgi:hypothetical protein